MRGIDNEKEMIRSLAEKTANKVIQPRVREIEETKGIPKDIIEEFGRQGFLSLLLPEEYGGTNGNIISLCLVVEEIAKVCGSSSMLILSQGIGTLPIILSGNESQKEALFTKITEKNSLTAFAFRESEFLSEALSINTTAKKEGKYYLINGKKCFVTNGSIAQIYSVFAKTKPERGEEGISAFLVEDGAKGLRFGKREEKLGIKGTVITDVIFENCLIPQENILGEEGNGWKYAMATLNMSRPAIGAHAVGIAQGALDYTIKYTSERIQFNQPISSFQAVRFMIADMATQIETARTLVYQSASQIDEKIENSEKISAIAKIFATNTAMKVTTDAVQLLGGYGYIKDYPVERMMRDAKVTQIFGEPNQSLRLIISESLLKDYGITY